MMKSQKGEITLITGVIGGLILSTIVIVSLFIANNKQKTATTTSVSENTVTLSLKPELSDLFVGDTQTVDLIATFSNGSAEEKLNYFKTEIDFPSKYIKIAPESLVLTNSSGLKQILRVDFPEKANTNGKLIIQIGAVTNNDARPSTNTVMKIATITFHAVLKTPKPIIISINKNNTEVVNNFSPDPEKIPVSVKNAAVSID